MKRSDLAKELFPDMSQKDAGLKVWHIINDYKELKTKMVRSGYISGERGYTPEQVRMICEFIENHKIL